MKFQPIVSVEGFFYDEPDSQYVPLPTYSLEQSPCSAIINKKRSLGMASKTIVSYMFCLLLG